MSQIYSEYHVARAAAVVMSRRRHGQVLILNGPDGYAVAPMQLPGLGFICGYVGDDTFAPIVEKYRKRAMQARSHWKTREDWLKYESFRAHWLRAESLYGLN